MTLTKKFTAIAAVVVIGALSIYATLLNFQSTNKTTQPVNETINCVSGAQIFQTLAPGVQLLTPIQDDQVQSVTIYNCIIPAGSNAIVPNPSGGTVIVRWGTGNNSVEIDPSEVS